MKEDELQAIERMLQAQLKWTEPIDPDAWAAHMRALIAEVRRLRELASEHPLKDFMLAQRDLPDDLKRILNQNLWKLYDSDGGPTEEMHSAGRSLESGGANVQNAVAEGSEPQPDHTPY